MVEILANQANFRRSRVQPIKYIVLHYTANDGDTARNNGNYFKNNKKGASAHYFVDENEVVRSVKDSDTAFHCETRGMRFKCDCRNSNSIGIEMCSRKDKNGKYYIKEETVLNAAKLVKELMKKYNIHIKNVIRHFDVCGKSCPKPFVENENKWKEFLNLLGKEMTLEEAKKIAKERFGFDETTMLYLEMYRYGEALIKRLAIND